MVRAWDLRFWIHAIGWQGTSQPDGWEMFFSWLITRIFDAFGLFHEDDFAVGDYVKRNIEVAFGPPSFDGNLSAGANRNAFWIVFIGSAPASASEIYDVAHFGREARILSMQGFIATACCSTYAIHFSVDLIVSSDGCCGMRAYSIIG